jgi:hypothetical protein
MNWREFTAIATGVLALGLIPTAIGIWVTYKAAFVVERLVSEVALG